MANINTMLVQQFINDLDYPATKGDLLRFAKHSSYGQRLVGAIKQIEEDEFETPADVSMALEEAME